MCIPSPLEKPGNTLDSQTFTLISGGIVQAAESPQGGTHTPFSIPDGRVLEGKAIPSKPLSCLSSENMVQLLKISIHTEGKNNISVSTVRGDGIFFFQWK